MQAATTLAAGESKVVDVQWRVLDAQKDSGEIKIVHNSGTDIIVPVTTPDLDPEIELTSQPDGVRPNEQRPDIDVTLTKARLGAVDAAVIKVKSIARAPLTVNQICLQQADGSCQDDPLQQWDAAGRFKLCGGRTANINMCPVAAIEDPIPFEGFEEFTVFFRPTDANDKGRSAKITIRSTSTLHPNSVVKVIGEVCDPDECTVQNPPWS